MQPFDKEYVCDIATQILNIDSPTGYTKRAIDFMDEEAKKLGYTTGRNQKGNLLIYVDGKDSEHTLGLSAHLDTLGLMVRSINDNGKLAITKVGGPCLPTLDGEYVRSILAMERYIQERFFLVHQAYTYIQMLQH